MKIIRIKHDDETVSIECTNSVHMNHSLHGEIDLPCHLVAGDDEELTIDRDGDGKMTLTGEEWAVSERSDSNGNFVYLNCPDSVRIAPTQSESIPDDEDLDPTTDKTQNEDSGSELVVSDDDDAQDDADEKAEDDLDVLIREALDGLDVENDDHWIQSGKPAMSYIEEACGTEDVTRKQVEAISTITRDDLKE